MPVLSKEDRAFWEENGYVIVHNAVPQENLDAMVAAIWEFLEMDPECEEDWYKYQPYTRDNRCSPISAAGMVEIYQHQALWDNRQNPKSASGFCRDLGRRETVGLAGPGQYETASARGSARMVQQGDDSLGCRYGTAAGVLWGARGAVFDGYGRGPRRLPVRTRLSPDVRRMGQDSAGGSRYAQTRSNRADGRIDCRPSRRPADLASVVGPRQRPQSV